MGRAGAVAAARWWRLVSTAWTTRAAGRGHLRAGARLRGVQGCVRGGGGGAGPVRHYRRCQKRHLLAERLLLLDGILYVVLQLRRRPRVDSHRFRLDLRGRGATGEHEGRDEPGLLRRPRRARNELRGRHMPVPVHRRYQARPRAPALRRRRVQPGRLLRRQRFYQRAPADPVLGRIPGVGGGLQRRRDGGQPGGMDARGWCAPSSHRVRLALPSSQ